MNIKNYLMMTRNNPNADIVDHLINELPENQSYKINGKKHTSSPRSQNRKDLWNEISTAVREKDILALRQEFQTIANNSEHNRLESDSVFDIAEVLDIPGFLNQSSVFNPDPLSFTEPLPKIHVHNHHRAMGETVHHFYKEQHKAVSDDFDFEEIAEGDEEWKLIGEAIMEKDIMDLHESLKQISSFYSPAVFSTAEIETYLEGLMPENDKIDFENELMINPELRADVKLNKELKEAVLEKDIFSLRDSLENIISRQNSTSKSIQEIDAFLNNELPDSERAAFLEELSDNNDLKAEVKLGKELNSAFSEKDVSNLRENLKRITIEIGQLEKKSFFPFHVVRKNVRKVGTVAAMFILLIGLPLLMYNSGGTENEILVKYMKTPQGISTFRSAEKNTNVDMEKAFELYNNADYQTALKYFQKILEKEATLPVAHFYSGASYQGLKSYEKAISEYNQVILDNNNMFVELAEWYRALCNFGLRNKESAIRQLEAINIQNGYFGKDARLLLKHLKLK